MKSNIFSSHPRKKKSIILHRSFKILEQLNISYLSQFTEEDTDQLGSILTQSEQNTDFIWTELCKNINIGINYDLLNYSLKCWIEMIKVDPLSSAMILKHGSRIFQSLDISNSLTRDLMRENLLTLLTLSLPSCQQHWDKLFDLLFNANGGNRRYLIF